MQFLLKLMGWFAQQSHIGGRHRHNGVPQNIAGGVGCAVIAFVCWLLYSFDGTLWALAGTLVLTPLSLIILVSISLKDTIFVKEPLPEALVADEALILTKFRWSGRLRLNERTAQRFMDVPVRARRMDNGWLSITAEIDASAKMYGFVVQARSGTWWSLPDFANLEIEAGTLYFGFKAEPSLRVKFTDKTDAKPSQAILSFDSAESRLGFYSWLLLEKQKVMV